MSASSWKERPVDLLAEARAAVSGQRRREIAGRAASGPPKADSSAENVGPYLIRNPKEYPTYPKSGTFRYSGLAKGYMWRWQQFLTGKTDDVPPTFREYRKDFDSAMRDGEMAEVERRRVEEIRRNIRASNATPGSPGNRPGKARGDGPAGGKGSS